MQLVPTISCRTLVYVVARATWQRVVSQAALNPWQYPVAIGSGWGYFDSKKG